jgi:hypothetical protein
MSAAPSTAYVDWYRGPRKQDFTTPRDLFDRLHAQYAFTLDGAADRSNALLPRFASETTPRLHWFGERVFCNPPWSNVRPFVELAATAELAVLLVPGRVNARWFHRALDLGGKPQFFRPKPKFGGLATNSPADCVLLVWGAEP